MAGGRSSHHVHCFRSRAAFPNPALGPCREGGGLPRGCAPHLPCQRGVRRGRPPAAGAFPGRADVGCGVISHSSLRHSLQVQSARLGRWPQAGGPHLTASPPLLVWVATLRCGDLFRRASTSFCPRTATDFLFGVDDTTHRTQAPGGQVGCAHACPATLRSTGGPRERRAGRSQRKPPRRLVRQIETCDRR